VIHNSLNEILDDVIDNGLSGDYKAFSSANQINFSSLLEQSEASDP